MLAVSFVSDFFSVHYHDGKDCGENMKGFMLSFGMLGTSPRFVALVMRRPSLNLCNKLNCRSVQQTFVFRPEVCQQTHPLFYLAHMC